MLVFPRLKAGATDLKPASLAQTRPRTGHSFPGTCTKVPDERNYRSDSAYACDHLSPVSEPLRKVCLAPSAILAHRVECPKWSIVEDRFVGSDEPVLHALSKGTSRRCFELIEPLLKLFRRRLLVHVVIVALQIQPRTASRTTRPRRNPTARCSRPSCRCRWRSVLYVPTVCPAMPMPWSAR